MRPWEDDTVALRLGAAPGNGVGLDDAVALPPARAEASRAVQVSVGPSVSVPETMKVSNGGSGGQKLGISAGYPVAHSIPAPAATPPAEQPVPTPVALPEPAPGPEAAPVATTIPTSPPGAVTAGGGAPGEGAESPGEAPEGEDGETAGIPVCEGEEYVVLAFLEEGDEATEGEEATVDILIQDLESDGSEGDIHLDDLSLDEAHSLIDLLVSAGDCEPVEPGLPAS